jgi:hypothetical protein
VSTVGEAGKLIETGWEYVTDMEGLKLFRKPKGWKEKHKIMFRNISFM